MTSERRTIFAIAGGLGLILALAYHNSFDGEFVFDDHASIVDNASIRRLWPLTSVLSPPETAGVGGRPVINLTFALNYAVGTLNPWSYHAFNLLVHLANALLTFGLVRRTLQLPSLPARVQRVALPLAAAAAALWALHPLQTQAVSYVSQRAESLMTLGYLTLLYAFVRRADAGARGWTVLALAAAALGMMCKEVMVTAPVMVFLYDRTFLAGSFREAWRRRGRLHAGLAASWLLLLPSLASLRLRGVGTDLGTSPAGYLLTQTEAVAAYLQRAFWPYPLVFDHGIVHVAPGPEWLVGTAFIVALLAAAVIALRVWPAVGYAAVWPFAILAPTSSFIPIVHQPITESRMYLPLVGICVLAAIGVHAVARRYAVPIGLAVLAGFTVLTAGRNVDYRSAIALWADTVSHRPQNARAHYNLGVALDAAGHAGQAIAHYERATAIHPEYPDPRNNLGRALLEAGRLEESLNQLTHAIRLRPDYDGARVNLGNALARSGRADEAIAQYESAIRINPANADAHHNLGTLVDASGRHAEAQRHFSRALALNPNRGETHYNLGNSLLRSGRNDEAVTAYTEALRSGLRNADVHSNLGRALLATGRPGEATQHFATALALAPSPDAHNNLAVVLQLQGRTAEAIEQCEAALRLDPGNATARSLLARMRATPPVSR